MTLHDAVLALYPAQLGMPEGNLFVLLDDNDWGEHDFHDCRWLPSVWSDQQTSRSARV
jgi:hypothetical protein